MIKEFERDKGIATIVFSPHDEYLVIGGCDQKAVMHSTADWSVIWAEI